MANTRIEWADRTWSPVTGCTKISEACEHCYTERMSKRLAGRYGYPADNPFQVTFHPDRLKEPLRWRKPSRIFVCSMGDLFHPDVPDAIKLKVFDVIGGCPQHVFMILTKRPEQMKGFIDKLQVSAYNICVPIKTQFRLEKTPFFSQYRPLRNLWLGVTCENQQRADERIPILLQIPAAKRFVSVEPMLGPVDINRWTKETCTNYGGIGRVPNHPHIPAHMCQRCKGTGKVSYPRFDWVICGGETGPGARPMHPKWVRSLRDQCQATGTAFFFKSWGDWCPSWCGAQSWEPDHNTPFYFFDSPPIKTRRIGKKKAGRLLDGQEWSQYPGVKA